MRSNKPIRFTSGYETDVKGYASGTQRSRGVSYSADELKSVNNFLYCLLEPLNSSESDIVVPDLKMNGRMPKSITYNVSFTPSSLDPADPPTKIMITFQPMVHGNNAFGIYGMRALDTEFYFFGTVSPDQDLSESFKFARYVSAGLGIISDTLSAGTFAVSGTMTSIWTKDPPKLDTVNSSTLASYASSTSDRLINSRLSEGVIIIGGPSADLSWFNPESNVIFDTGNSEYDAFYTYQELKNTANPMTRSNSAGFVITGVNVFDTNRNNVDLIDGLIGRTKITMAGSFARSVAVSDGFESIQVSSLVTYSAGGVDVIDNYPIPVSALSMTNMGPTDVLVFVINFSTTYNIITPSPIKRIQMIIAKNGSSPAIQANNNVEDMAAVFNVRIQNSDVATIGQWTGIGISIIEGFAADQSISLQGRINYEVVPDAELSRNIKIESVGADWTLDDIEYARVILNNKEAAGVRGVYSYNEYSDKCEAGFFRSLSTRGVHVALAADWRRGIKKAYKHLKPYGEQLLRKARPMAERYISNFVNNKMMAFSSDEQSFVPRSQRVAHSSDDPHRELRRFATQDDVKDVKVQVGEDQIPVISDLDIDPTILSAEHKLFPLLRRMVFRLPTATLLSYDCKLHSINPDTAPLHTPESRLITASLLILSSKSNQQTCSLSNDLLHHLYHINPTACNDVRVSLFKAGATELKCGYVQRAFATPSHSYDHTKTLKEFQSDLKVVVPKRVTSRRPNHGVQSFFIDSNGAPPKPCLTMPEDKRRNGKIAFAMMEGPAPEDELPPLVMPDDAFVRPMPPPGFEVKYPQQDIADEKNYAQPNPFPIDDEYFLYNKMAPFTGEYDEVDYPQAAKGGVVRYIKSSIDPRRLKTSDLKYCNDHLNYKDFLRPKYYNQYVRNMHFLANTKDVSDLYDNMPFRLAPFPVIIDGQPDIMMLAISEAPFRFRMEYFPQFDDAGEYITPFLHEFEEKVDYLPANVGDLVMYIDSKIDINTRLPSSFLLYALGASTSYVTILSEVLVVESSYSYALAAAFYGCPIDAIYSGSYLPTTQDVETNTIRFVAPGELRQKLEARLLIKKIFGLFTLPPFYVPSCNDPSIALVDYTSVVMGRVKRCFAVDTLTIIPSAEALPYATTQINARFRHTVATQVMEPKERVTRITDLKSVDINQLVKKIKGSGLPKNMEESYMASVTNHTTNGKKLNYNGIHKAIDDYVDARNKGKVAKDKKKSSIRDKADDLKANENIYEMVGETQIDIPSPAEILREIKQYQRDLPDNMDALFIKLLKAYQQRRLTRKLIPSFNQLYMYVQKNIVNRRGKGKTAKRQTKVRVMTVSRGNQPDDLTLI